LGLTAWSLDYTPDANGLPDLPLRTIPNTPYDDLKWTHDEDLDPNMRALQASVEFAGEFSSWSSLHEKVTSDLPEATAWVNNPALPSLQWTQNVNYVNGELAALRERMADERDRYMPEIVAQSNGISSYWLNLLGIGGERHYWTVALMGAALRCGEMAMIHYKDQVRRPRPSELCNGLLLPFGFPRHSSWPSGHSTQGHLLSRLLLNIPGVMNRFGPDAGDPGELMWLALRCAQSRERAGFHYRTDTLAGMSLAKMLEKVIIDYIGTNSNSMFARILNNAQAEWP
jgi:hypothetical protein